MDIEQFFSVNALAEQEDISTYYWAEVLLLLYGIGILFFLGRNLYSTIRILLLLSNGRTNYLNDNYKLILHEQKIAPFSWMNFIVVSETDFEEAGDKIIIHEMTHIRKKHSLDLIFAELAILFHWFNPAIWLLKYELHNIHEYQADESVLQQGIDAKQYQLLLIKKAVGTVRFNSLANSFSHSKLKKRITMMLKRKSSPWARLKFLYVIPITGIAITVFARPEVSNKLNEISEVKVSDLSGIMKEQQKIEGEEGVNGKSVESANFKIGAIVSPDAGNEKEESVQVSSLFMVKGKDIDSSTLNSIAPLVIVDGKEIDFSALNSIAPADIESIEVLKDKSAELYGEKGKNGVVIINLK